MTTTRQASDGTEHVGHSVRSGRRAIGRWGTLARLVAGAVLLGDVGYGQWTGEFRPASWLLGLVGFPAVLLAVQWLRSRGQPAPMRATGPVGHAVNLLVFLALYLTPWYAPPLGVTSDAALVFDGVSMLVAAARGYGGCEVVAVSNWILRRDDQVGCVVFAPIDVAERHAQAVRPKG